MRIGIDVRVLSRGTVTGVEEYTLNLLSALLFSDKSNNYFLFYNAYNKVNLNFDWLSLSNVNLKQFQIPNRFFFISARYLKFPKIDKLLSGIDVYFNPHFFAAPVSKKCSKITTFHDLSFERHPEFFSFKKRNWHEFLIKPKKEAKEAKFIIAVSESTKQDLVDIYGINSEKIKVIYPGISLSSDKFKTSDYRTNLERVKKKYKLPGRFILYFGTIEPRKNIKGLIEAFENLNSSYSNKNGYKLVIAGSKGWLYKDIIKKARDSKFCKDIFFTGYVQQEDKPYLYSLSDLFVYPSFFEGFGFPPLEAMACGVPTITSNNSSLPEVVGDGALMINAYNVDEMTWSIKEVLENNSLRKKMIKKGFQRVGRFSWDKCADKINKLLISN